MASQSKQEIQQMIKGSPFLDALNAHFPGSMLLEDYMSAVSDKAKTLNFNSDNTIACVSVCRDELTYPFLAATEKHWGNPFNFSGLAGFMTFGKTGLGAGLSHAPISNNLERYIFFALPHIAISDNGEVGTCSREGREAPSSACGALAAVRNGFQNDSVPTELDMNDIEQSVLSKKIAEKIPSGSKPDLLTITETAAEIIQSDLEALLKSVDDKKCDYILFTGIQIHGPNGTDFICPRVQYSKLNKNNNTKEEISLGNYDLLA